MADTLFDLPPDATVTPEPVEKLSADRRRTIRQAQCLAFGRHPLLGDLLHQQAAPADDRKAPGRRCGNCWYRRLTSTGSSRDWPKCFVDVENPTDTHPYPVSLRLTRGAATDVRAWWPACSQHVYGEPGLSADAARYVPEEAS